MMAKSANSNSFYFDPFLCVFFLQSADKGILKFSFIWRLLFVFESLWTTLIEKVIDDSFFLANVTQLCARHPWFTSIAL